MTLKQIEYMVQIYIKTVETLNMPSDDSPVI